MVKQIFCAINKLLTVSILIFLLVSLTSEVVSGSSNFTNNSALSSYSGKYFVPSSNSSSGYIKIIDLINVSVKISVSRLHTMELYIPSLGSSNCHIPTSYLIGSFVPSSYLGKNYVQVSGTMKGSIQSSYLRQNYVPVSDTMKDFVPSLNSGKDSVMIYNLMKDYVPPSD